MPILKSQSYGPLYCNTVIGTLAVDGLAVTLFWCSEEGPGRAAAPLSPLLAVPNVIDHPSTSSVLTSYYLMWHYNCLWTLKGQVIAAVVIYKAVAKLHVQRLSCWIRFYLWPSLDQSKPVGPVCKPAVGLWRRAPHVFSKLTAHAVFRVASLLRHRGYS